MVVVFVLGCAAMTAVGVSAGMTAAAAGPVGCVAPNASTLREFFGAIPSVAPGGMVVSVVSGDQTVLAQGYGTLDAQRSLVRIASITKLFTWTAVMQQVEAGRLGLNTDVNRYLTGFEIPATYPQPITLLTLMNHTSGFEDRIIGTAARTAAEVVARMRSAHQVLRPIVLRRHHDERTDSSHPTSSVRT